MTTSLPPQAIGTVNRWRFLGHFAEMLAAMILGMVLLGPLWEALPGGPALLARPDLAVLVMATDMTVGMSLWMRYRGHGWGAIAEMGAAMYAPFAVLLVPYWTGLLSGHALMMAGHVLMVPAMLLVMLRRRAEYGVAHHHHRTARRGLLERRWPTLLGLVMTLACWVDPMLPPAPVLLVLPGTYLVIGLFRRTLRGPGVVALQLAALAGYAALMVAALAAGPDTARYLIAAGWLAHAAWDAAHFVTRRVVPRGYAEWCGVVDLVVGVTILLVL
ncbi:hypothetical protein [Nonomuraea rhodomycinica]|uniref:Uncharacterized protein n=1 Tax=Nonomuraea rhodomycinica TaxID=1712872 RepID=A0A7Y6IKB9_9ACTN|nr:hypothetical protein [Nonomuraea rhodomycinica]NUW39621.1 hypothetical protein [Nonomuraea rhodomycinica]